MEGKYNFEQEIQSDEERIARYFDKLPFYLDLPGENEAIFEQLAKAAGEKVRSFATIDDLRQTMPGEESDEDEFDFKGRDRSVACPAGYEMLDMLDDISVYYSQCFALNDENKTAEKYISILCQCGKTLARISDLIYTPADEKDMIIVLGKRALKDVNDLSMLIESLKNTVHSNPVQQEQELLQIIRKKVLDMLFEAYKE